MNRKIKKLLDYCKSHEEKVFNAMFNSSMIIGAVIFGLIAFKYNEPKKMTRSEVEKAIVAYCDPVGTPCKECKCYKNSIKVKLERKYNFLFSTYIN